MKRGFLKGLLVIAVFTMLLSISNFSALAIANNRPFPQHVTYYAGTIKPSNYTQASMDNTVKALYDAWKNHYLKDAGSDWGYYVWYEDEIEGAVCASEGQGYGMLLTVLMAGYDTNAKAEFDGLLKFYQRHPSKWNSKLMGWLCKGPPDYLPDNDNDYGGDEAATDGDMDAAYACLLADKQWGSSGAINYKQVGIDIINAIMLDEVDKTKWTLKLGDWYRDPNDNDYHATRPSDFMLNHMKAFQAATGDIRWNNVIDKTYIIINQVIDDYSANTGLLPDFLVYDSAADKYKPGSPVNENGEKDKCYFYNACRTPWRIGTDYLLTGDDRAYTKMLTRMNAWIQTKTNRNVNKINAGYKLGGAKLATDHNSCFTVPFGVAAMVSGSGSQAWLNKEWVYCRNTRILDDDYFGDTVKLLNMIVISGNWWTP